MRARIVALVLPACLGQAAPARAAGTDLEGMLAAAEAGDARARVLVGYSHLLGEYRDGTPVEKDLALAYAWASLANYQGDDLAQDLLNRVIPRLEDRAAADALAGELFLEHGVEKGSARNP